MNLPLMRMVSADWAWAEPRTASTQTKHSIVSRKRCSALAMHRWPGTQVLLKKLGPGSALQHFMLLRARDTKLSILDLQPLQGALGLDEHVLGAGRRAAIDLGKFVAGLFAGDLDVVGRDVLVDVAAIETEYVGLDRHRLAHLGAKNDLRVG